MENGNDCGCDVVFSTVFVFWEGSSIGRGWCELVEMEAVDDCDAWLEVKISLLTIGPKLQTTIWKFEKRVLGLALRHFGKEGSRLSLVPYIKR